MSAAKKPLTFDIDRSPPAPSEPRRTALARASQTSRRRGSRLERVSPLRFIAS